MRNDKGLTLVELIVVIGICGILAAIAAASMTNLVRKGRIENQTRRIYADLNNARLRAMNNNMMHFFRIVGNSYEIWADTSNTGANYETYDGGDSQVLQRGGADIVPFTFSGAVPGSEATQANNGIRFNARGLASTQGTICVGGNDVVTQPQTNCAVVSTTKTRLGWIKIQDIKNGDCDADHCREVQ